MSQTLDLPRKMAHSEGNIVVEVVNRLRHAAALLLGRLVTVTTPLIARVTLHSLLLLRGRVVVVGSCLRPALRRALVHATFATTAVEHLHLAIDIDHNLGGVTVLAVLPLPLTGLQAPFDINLGAFAQVLPGHFGHFAEQYHTVPFGSRHQLTGLTILVAFIGRQGEVYHRIAVGGIAGIRILAQITDKNYLVYASCHCMLLVSFAERLRSMQASCVLSSATLPHKFKVRKLLFPKMLTVYLQVRHGGLFHDHHVFHARQFSQVLVDLVKTDTHGVFQLYHKTGGVTRCRHG